MPWPSSTTWHPLQYRPWKGQENGFIISKPLQHPSWRYLTRLISSDAHCGIHRLNHRIAWGEQQKHSTLAMTQQSIKSEIWKTIHNCRDSAMTICVYECNSIALLFIADTLKLTRCSFVGLCCLKSSLFNQCMLLKRMIARTSYNWYCARLLLRCVPTKYHHLYFTSLLSSLLFTLLLHHLLCFLRLPSTIIDGSPSLSSSSCLSHSMFDCCVIYVWSASSIVDTLPHLQIGGFYRDLFREEKRRSVAAGMVMVVCWKTMWANNTHRLWEVHLCNWLLQDAYSHAM